MYLFLRHIPTFHDLLYALFARSIKVSLRLTEYIVLRYVSEVQAQGECTQMSLLTY